MGVIGVKDFETISSFFRGERGHKRAERVIRLLAIDRVNNVYDRSSNFTGADFCARLLDDLGVHYVIGNAERLKQLPEGAFITISNHPYGGLDGIMTIDLFAGIRPDYRFMVNKMLSMVKTLNKNFISVTPTGNKKADISAASINGIRETLAHLQNGHPVGFFPSGAVSDFSLRDMRIRDRNWQESILHLIHTAKVPILPVRFFDTNSSFFYFLGLISWKIRTLRMPYELFNKSKHEPRIGIGNLISIMDQEQYPDYKSLGIYLRKVVYEMPLPEKFVTVKLAGAEVKRSDL
jgi:putative hemolysin